MIRTFLMLTFTLSAVFYALMIVSGHVGGGAGRYATGIMWCPGLAALVTCRIHAIRIAVLGWQWAIPRDRVPAGLPDLHASRLGREGALRGAAAAPIRRILAAPRPAA